MEPEFEIVFPLEAGMEPEFEIVFPFDVEVVPEFEIVFPLEAGMEPEFELELMGREESLAELGATVEAEFEIVSPLDVGLVLTSGEVFVFTLTVFASVGVSPIGTELVVSVIPFEIVVD